MEERKRGKPTAGDRISALPEPIIHHILSFLRKKNLKVTSSLSKTWYHISKSFPFLDFDFYASRFKHKFKQCKYLNYVDRTLLRFHKHNDLNLQIQRFSLTIPVTLIFSRVAPLLLDDWIYLVLHREIQELNLDIRGAEDYDINGPSWYNLLQSVFAAKSIKVAKFGGISLLQSFPCGSGSNLQKLHLDHVLLDDHILSLIISICPLIEDLYVFSCIGIERFHIYNLKKLSTLRISHSIENKPIAMVEIDAPNLQKLVIHGSVKVRVLECPKLMDLTLNEVLFEEFGLQDFLQRLSFLRRLNLGGLSSLTRLNMSSDTLNKIDISRCNSLVQLKIDAPNLGLLLCTSKYRIFSLTRHMVRCSWHGSINAELNPITIEDFLVLVRNFVSKSRHLKTINLRLENFQPVCFEDLNKRVVQPVVNIDHLDLFMTNDVSEISYLDIFDYVLWSCHPRTLSFHDPNNDAVMSLCEVTGHSHRPCKLERNWLHYLEEVRYVVRDTSEGQLPIDGNSCPCLSISYSEIKLAFKW